MSDSAQYGRVASCMAMDIIRAHKHLLAVLFVLVLNAVRFLSQGLLSRATLSAENLFLRRQLALYAERRVKARRANHGTRLAMALLSRFFAWKDALMIVKPGTSVCWHRKGFRLFGGGRAGSEAGRGCRWSFVGSSCKWGSETQPGARSGLPLSCF